jgi:hypothetical protein
LGQEALLNAEKIKILAIIVAKYITNKISHKKREIKDHINILIFLTRRDA